MGHALLLPIILSLASGALQPEHGAAPEAELRHATQELLDAIAPGRADVWRTFLDDRMIRVDENGVVQDKASILKELTPLPAGLTGSIRIASFRVVVHGGVAVATHEDDEDLDYFGQKVATRFRTTDTWIEAPVGWRLLASQVMAVLDDPPAASMEQDKLCAYAGTFALTSEIATRIRCEDGRLVSERTGRPPVAYLPETPDVFFAPGQPRTRRIFRRDANGVITGFVDRREGHDITWTKVASAAR